VFIEKELQDECLERLVPFIKAYEKKLITFMICNRVGMEEVLFGGSSFVLRFDKGEMNKFKMQGSWWVKYGYLIRAIFTLLMFFFGGKF
jgi:hypothetical protein